MSDKKLRVVHYLNQFYAGIGGEEKADIGVSEREGVVGPGMALRAALGNDAEIVATVICGDSYFNENIEEASKEVIAIIRKHNPDVVVAGPAFNAGRYGVACGAVAKAVVDELGIPVVSGMYPENPGVEMYRKYAYIVETGNSAATMRQAIPQIAKLVVKLGTGAEMGSAAEEGYMERGGRRNVFVSERGSSVLSTCSSSWLARSSPPNIRCLISIGLTRTRLADLSRPRLRWSLQEVSY